MKIALKLAYLGENYYGFQRQPSLVTVDSEVRKALTRIGVINGDFCYAGRTDRSVSALGQVIDFSIDEDRAYLARPRCLNGRLPRDIWAWAWTEVPPVFSARWDALWREYRYLLWHPGLDLELMRSAGAKLLGTHDFRNFSSTKVDTVRDVMRLVVEDHGGMVTIDIRGNGFLWNMVRRMVSALEAVGCGERDLEWIDELLDPSINEGAPTAPAEGLILMDVGYDGLKWHVDDYSRARAARALSSLLKRQMASGYVVKTIEAAMKDDL